MPLSDLVEALSTITCHFNIIPTKTLSFSTPYFSLFESRPSYYHLHAFNCKCYPNTSVPPLKKLSPRSTMCVFVGYSTHHKGCVVLISILIVSSYLDMSSLWRPHFPPPRSYPLQAMQISSSSWIVTFFL